MSQQRKRIAALVSALLSVVVLTAFAPGAAAGILPLRSGTVVAKTDAGAFTYLKAVDDAGKQFWVLTSICTIGEKGKVAVLAGAHYDKLKTEHQGVIEDVYTAQLLKLNDLEVNGFGAHGLPAGCVALE